MPAPTHEPAITDEPDDRHRPWRRVGVLAVIASFVGVWGYVMYLSIFQGRAEPRDRLDDTAWTETADAACARSASVFERLPFANEADSPQERAGFLAEATAELELMVGRLESLAPPHDGAEARAVRAWLDDYRTFIGDRREYEQRLAAGEDDAFTVTDRGGYQIDVLIDDFARVNYMDACETPDDVG